MGSQFSVHLLNNRNKDLLYPVSQIKQKQTKSRAMDVKTKLAEDMRKLTLKLGRKKDKVAQSVNDKQTVKDAFKLSPPAPKTETASSTNESVEKPESVKTVSTRPELLPSKVQPAKQAKGLPHHIVAATRVSERKWTLSDLLRSLGAYVHNHCVHLHSAPTAGEVAMWVRCADRALQLNGWTINSFLLESHVVFTYMLIASAFRQGYELHTLADVKELVLMCLYVSYTYNANEISYPLRPFLVKQDRAAFWDKCTALSLSASSNMLRLNRDHTFYKDMLSSLKRVALL